MATNFAPYPGALDRLLRSPDGPVGRDVARRARRVQAAARAGVRSRTGRLAASIAVELVRRGGVPTARVGSPLDYARFVHEGRGPVRASGRALVFVGRGGQLVFTRAVGAARGHPFLTEALREAVR